MNTASVTIVDRGGAASPHLPAGVGETPLIEIEGVYIKLECLNPCGSVKDRIASYIITKARETGQLKPGQRIVEATSGNTGIAFAYYGTKMGHPVTIVMPEHMTEERKQLIRELGADLVLCSEAGSFCEAAAIRDKMATECGAFNPDQFSNELNSECHAKTTACELLRQANGVQIDAFVAGVGTGGTLVGVGGELKRANANCMIYAVEPAEAAVMTGGPNESHGIYGIGDGFIPALAGDGCDGLHPMIDGVEVISTEDAKEMARHISANYGICIGISSGANFLAAKNLQKKHKTVATVFSDGHQKYHSAGINPPSPCRCPFQEPCSQSILERTLTEIRCR